MAGDPWITCTSKEECPATHVCAELLGWCVPRGENSSLPVVLTTPLVIKPERGRQGGTFVLRFVVGEEWGGAGDWQLGRDPEVYFEFGDSRAPFDLVERATERWSGTYWFVYVVRGDEVGDDEEPLEVPFHIDLVGPTGVPNSRSGSAWFDFKPPRLNAGLEQAVARRGTEVVLTLNFDEGMECSSLETCVAVSMRPESGSDRRVIVWPPAAASGHSDREFVFRLPVDERVREAWYRLTVTGSDLAGNPVVEELERRLEIDDTAPSAALVRAPVLVGGRDEVAVTLLISEELRGWPRLFAVPEAAAPGEEGCGFVLTDASGDELTYELNLVTAPDCGAEGRYWLELRDLEDRAGNRRSVVRLDRFAVDITAPELLAFDVLPANDPGTPLSGDATLRVEFQASEPPLAEDPIVSIRDRFLVKKAEVDGRYVYELPLADSGLDNLYHFQVVLLDRAGNRATQEYDSAHPVRSRMEVHIDTVAPHLQDAYLLPPRAGAEQPVVLVVAADEMLRADLDPSTQVMWRDDQAPGVLERIDVEGFAYVLHYRVGADLAEQERAVEQVTLIDLAGNTATISTPATTVALKSIQPRIDVLDVDGGHFSDRPGHDELRASLALSEPIEPSAISLTLGQSAPAAPCVAVGEATQYQCLLRVERTALSPEMAEGVALLVVEVRDRYGNSSVRTTGTHLDFAPPQIVPGGSSVVLIPPADSPLEHAEQATHGTVVQVAFSLDEAVADPDGVRVFTATEPSLELVEVDPQERGTQVSFLFELSLPESGDLPQGEISLLVNAEDRVGNPTGEPQVLGATFVIDTERPAPPDPEFVLHRRVPWGWEASAGFPAAEVVWQPGALTEPGGWVVVFDAQGVEGLKLGLCLGDGATCPINPTDRSQIFVAQLDRAGNRSDLVAVQRGEWVVTMGRKVVGSTVENPHQYWTQRYHTPWLRRTSGTGESAIGVGGISGDVVNRLALPDDSNVRTTGAIGYWKLLASAPLPALLDPFLTGVDSLRGRLILEGRRGGSPVTWEWNGHRWLVIPVQDPEYDGRPGLETASVGPDVLSTGALAFNESRGVLTLVVCPSDCETWQWDGNSWRRWTPPLRPTARIGHTLVYDPVGHRTLLFGGYRNGLVDDGTWSWDGTVWSQVGDDSTDVACWGHGVAFDEEHDEVVLFGGRDTGGLRAETWLFQGDVWWHYDGAGPSARLGHGMAYDRDREVVVLYGGKAADGENAETWEWSGAPPDGSGWRDATPVDGSPPPTADAQLVFDNQRRAVVLIVDDGVWIWDGSSWRLERPLPHLLGGQFPPLQLDVAGLAYDSDREVVVLAGGRLDFEAQTDTWEWNGEGWTLKSQEMPNGFLGAQMVYSPRLHRTLYHDNAVTYGWDGTSWQQRATSSTVSGWSGMVFNEAIGRVFMFGGQGTEFLQPLNLTWQLGSGTWTQLQPDAYSTEITPRQLPTLVYDRRLGSVVLHGGRAGITGDWNLHDFWRWQGGAWTFLSNGIAGLRMAHSKGFYLPASDKVLLFGKNVDRLLEVDGAEVIDRSGDLVDLWGDGVPIAADLVTAYDEARDQLVAVGAGATKDLRGQWIWRPAFGARPRHMLQLKWSAAELSDAVRVETVELRARGSGRGYTSGAPVDGIEAEVWDRGRWRPVGEVGDEPSVVLTGEEVRRAVVQDTVNIALVPVAGNGAEEAVIEMDYVELGIRYRLDGP